MQRILLTISFFLVLTTVGYSQQGTARTWAEIMNLLPDNTTGEISPQDLRDLWQTTTDSAGTALATSRTTRDSILIIGPIARAARDSALSAQTAASTAQTTADNAQTAANNAQTTADNVLPSQAGQNGKFLTTDGTNASWAATGGGDMLTSVYDPSSVSGDAFAMDNMVEGVNTKVLTSAERSNIATNTAHVGNTSNPHSVTATQVLPSQAGQNGNFLTTNGTDVSWAATSGAAIDQVARDSAKAAQDSANSALAQLAAAIVRFSQHTKTIGAIPQPAAGDSVHLGYFERAATLDSIYFYLDHDVTGDATVQLYYSTTNYDQAATTVFTAAVSTATAGWNTTFANSSIPAKSYMWMKVLTVTDTANQLEADIAYHE